MDINNIGLILLERGLNYSAWALWCIFVYSKLGTFKRKFLYL